MVFDTPLLITQHYKVWIKGKVEKSREKNSTFSLHLDVVAIGKGAFGSLLTMVANFTYFYRVYSVCVGGYEKKLLIFLRVAWCSIISVEIRVDIFHSTFYLKLRSFTSSKGLPFRESPFHLFSLQPFI